MHQMMADQQPKLVCAVHLNQQHLSSSAVTARDNTSTLRGTLQCQGLPEKVLHCISTYHTTKYKQSGYIYLCFLLNGCRRTRGEGHTDEGKVGDNDVLYVYQIYYNLLLLILNTEVNPEIHLMGIWF